MAADRPAVLAGAGHHLGLGAEAMPGRRRVVWATGARVRLPRLAREHREVEARCLVARATGARGCRRGAWALEAF